MQNISSLTRTITLLIISLTLFNCSTDNDVISDNNENAKVSNLDFLNLNSDYKKSSLELSINQHLDYVLFDGIPAKTFMAENDVDTESFINYLTDKVESMDNRVLSQQSNFAKNGGDEEEEDELSLEEIRDAMINECENGYCCGLDDACSLAVKIAYHIKKAQE